MSTIAKRGQKKRTKRGSTSDQRRHDYFLQSHRLKLSVTIYHPVVWVIPLVRFSLGGATCQRGPFRNLFAPRCIHTWLHNMEAPEGEGKCWRLCNLLSFLPLSLSLSLKERATVMCASLACTGLAQSVPKHIYRGRRKHHRHLLRLISLAAESPLPSESEEESEAHHNLQLLLVKPIVIQVGGI